METTETRPTRHNITHESMSIERLEQAHKKAMDIEDGTCMDDGAGVMDCPFTRERMYADRLRRAYEHKRKAESIGDPIPDAQAQLNATITQYDAPHHTTPHHTTPHHTTPHHTTPHHNTPHHTTPQHTTQQHNTLQSLTHSTGYTLTAFLMRLYLIPSVTLQLHSLSISYVPASLSLMQSSLRSTSLFHLFLSCYYLFISPSTTLSLIHLLLFLRL